MLALGLTLLSLVGCTREEPVGDDVSVEPVADYDPLVWVDPFIGTGGPGASVGSLNPGAVLPHGLVQLGPTTRGSFYAPFYHCGGYYYDDTYVVGYGHTFAHGMGVTDYGGINVMPKPSWDPSYTDLTERRSAFSHDQEEAAAGYYSVVQLDDDITVELTATEHAGMHRWTFPEGLSAPTALFDLHFTNNMQSDRVDEAEITVDLDSGRVSGTQRLLGGYSGRFGGLRHHFVAELDPKPISAGTWGSDPEELFATLTAQGEGAGAWLIFPEGTTEVKMRIGVSFVDEDGAAANLAEEVPSWDFEALRASAEESWRERLSGVRVRPPAADDVLFDEDAPERGTRADRHMHIFHTALYHAHVWPRTFTDVDGRYRGLDGEVHGDPGFAYYTDFSLWDTFRTLHPWFTLEDPELENDMVSSLLQMSRDGGSLPKWPMAHGYTGGMIGSPAQQVVAGSWLKGVRDFDEDEAWELVHKAALEGQPAAGRVGLESYQDLGYVSFEAAGDPASRTLEFAWSDASLVAWGDALGKDTSAIQAQAGNWKNTYDSETGFFWGRHADGTFETVDPTHWNEGFTEGSAWHYVWMVPQDVPGMIELQHGGDTEAFLERYDDFWAESYQEEDGAAPEKFYWHGNEPDIHYAFMGSLAGHADHSADPARFVLDERYDDIGFGLDGNDDGGTLSAWYLWGASGLFPVAGFDTYALGSPIFERVEIDRPDGTLVIRAPGVSEQGRYIQAATLGGEPFSSPTLTHAELIEGGELVLELGPQRQGWGAP